MQVLKQYPHTKKVFIKYNIQLLLLLATIERLFTYAIKTNLPKSNKLSC